MKAALLFLLMAGSFPKPAPAVDLSDLPEMAPEECAKYQPAELYNRLVTREPHPLGIDSSLRGEDDFHENYRSQLQKYVDAHYPDARKYREEMHAAFHSMMHFIEEVYAPMGLKHHDEHVGGEVEWIIFQAEKKKYHMPDRNKRAATDVEEYALAMSKRFGRNWRFDDLALPHLHDAILHLIKATGEDGMPDKHMRWYFAYELEHFLAAYSKKPKGR